MTSMDNLEWTKTAKHVDNASLDVGFVISDSFYYGADNDFTPEEWESSRTRITQPELPKFGDFVLGEDVGDAGELLKYYRDVLILAKEHNKQIENRSSYFWIRPLIYKRDEFAITFPWYDTYEEIRRFLESAEEHKEGQVFWDRDQCWELTAHARNGRLYIREWDPDYEEEHVSVSLDFASLRSQIEPTRNRIDNILTQLRAALGKDYW